jgi:hypothetical protein
MIIKGKLLIGVAIGAIALFLIASPLGDAHHASAATINSPLT